MSAKNKQWIVGYGDGVTGPTASPLVWWDRTDVKSQIVSCEKEVIAIVARDGGLTDEDQERARLIAAAPDLLAALQKYIAAGFGNSTDFAAQGDAYDSAINAIAKATGEQQ